MGATARHRGCGFRRGNSLLLFWYSVGTRCGIPSLLVARGSVAMEARHLLSALGRPGALRLRRAEIRVLPACLVDSWRRIERDFSLDRRLQHLRMDGAGGGGYVDVRASAAVV